MLYFKIFKIFAIVAFFQILCANSNSCDDDGMWAELLASAPSLHPTYILGGLFDIHQSSMDNNENNDDLITTQQCDCTYQETVFLAEAMIYAIELINESHDLLADIRLGYNILGSCDTPSENAYYALEEYSLFEMRMINVSEPSVETIDHIKQTPVTAIIGPCSTDGSISIANVLQSYKIPIISYGATVSELSKRSRFPTLFRTTYSDDKQVEALADLSRTFNWTYIAAVGSDDDLGHEGVQAFKQMINSRGLCLSSEAYFDDESDDAHLYQIIENLKHKQKDDGVVNVVLLFMEWKYASIFLKQANSQQLANMTWLGVDHWASDVGMTYWMADDYLPAAFTKGTIATQFSSSEINAFADYMEQNLSERMRRNKWLMYFYCDQCYPSWNDANGQNRTVCTLESALSDDCVNQVDLRAIVTRQRRIPNVFSAVYAAAYALDSVLSKKTSNQSSAGQHSIDQSSLNTIDSENRTFDSDFKNQNRSLSKIHQIIQDYAKFNTLPKDMGLPLIDYDKLIKSLAAVNFSYTVGTYRSPEISFRPDGDLNDASFEIVNFYQPDQQQCYLPSKSQYVGFWKEDDEDDDVENDDSILKIDCSRIHWQTDRGNRGPPDSYCHRSCYPGEKLVPGPTSCCWSCEGCPSSTYSDTYNSPECIQCGPHTHSNADNTACVENIRIWIGYSNPIAIMCMVFCATGELLNFIAAVIICRAAKAHSLNYDDGGYAMKTVVFVNFALAYGYVIAIFAQPSVHICTIRLVMWQTLGTANLVAKFFMLPRGRRAAARLARKLGMVKPSATSTPVSRSVSSDSASSDSNSSSVSNSSFAYRWICELCYAAVVTVAVGAYVLVGVLVPATVIESELIEHDEAPPKESQTMLNCGPNYIVVGVTFAVLSGLWVLNLSTSSNLYRRARRRRCRSAFSSSTLTMSGQSIAKRSAVEFHANNLLWSGYLTVLVLIVVVPLYVTTDDPWSRALFQIFTPFVLITLLLGVFALPRCWQALRYIYCGRRAGGDEDDVFRPGPFVNSMSHDLQVRKMSTIPEDETSEF